MWTAWGWGTLESASILFMFIFHALSQVHRLHLCTAELLAATMADVQGVSQPPVSCHPWALLDVRCVSLQERVRDVWGQHFGVSQRSTGHHSIGKLLQDLKSAECPAPTTSVPLRQVRSPRSTSPLGSTSQSLDLVSFWSSGPALFIPPSDPGCAELAVGRRRTADDGVVEGGGLVQRRRPFQHLCRDLQVALP